MVDGAANGAAAWPVYTVYFSDVPLLMSHLAGLVTWAMAATGVWMAVLLAKRLPLTAAHSDLAKPLGSARPSSN
jgi:hypothetical protein